MKVISEFKQCVKKIRTNFKTIIMSSLIFSQSIHTLKKHKVNTDHI